MARCKGDKNSPWTATNSSNTRSMAWVMKSHLANKYSNRNIRNPVLVPQIDCRWLLALSSYPENTFKKTLHIEYLEQEESTSSPVSSERFFHRLLRHLGISGFLLAFSAKQLQQVPLKASIASNHVKGTSNVSTLATPVSAYCRTKCNLHSWYLHIYLVINHYYYLISHILFPSNCILYIISFIFHC